MKITVRQVAQGLPDSGCMTALWQSAKDGLDHDQRVGVDLVIRLSVSTRIES
jgi:hypothetical protein